MVNISLILQTLLSNVQPRVGSFTSPQLNTSKQKSFTHLRSVDDVGAAETLSSELAEVCLDMLARYAYSNLSTQSCRYCVCCVCVCCVCVHVCCVCVVCVCVVCVCMCVVCVYIAVCCPFGCVWLCGPCLLCRSAGLGSLFSIGCSRSKTWAVGGNSLVSVTTSGSGGGTCAVCTNQKGNGPHPFSTSSRPRPAHQGCSARGWAEIKIRKPTGVVSWVLKVQNRLQIYSSTQPREWLGDNSWDLLLFNQPGIEPLQDDRNRENFASLHSGPTASIPLPLFVPEKEFPLQDVPPSAPLLPEEAVSIQSISPSGFFMSEVNSGPLSHPIAPLSMLCTATKLEDYSEPKEVPGSDPLTPKVTEAPGSDPLTPKVTEAPGSDPLTPKVTEAPGSDPLTPKVTEAPGSDPLTPKVTEAPGSDPLTLKVSEVPGNPATPKVTEVPGSDPLTPKVTEAPGSDPLIPKVTEAPGSTPTPRITSTLSLDCVNTEQYEDEDEEDEDRSGEEDGEGTGEEANKGTAEGKGHQPVSSRKWLLHNLAKRHSTSLSWSEGGDSPTHTLRRRVSIPSLSTELLPPLLSYDHDEDTVLGRSPSLCGKQDLLSEEQQVQ